MKHLRVLFCIALCLAVAGAVVYAKDVDDTSQKIHRLTEIKHVIPAVGTQLHVPRASAQASTTWLGTWGFDSGASCVDQGWVHLDKTEQLDDYWHVDDFDGLESGTYGLLEPLQGGKSAWCGTRLNPSDLRICSYVAPGYGNNWDQYFGSTCITVTGNVEINYLIAWDAEPDYDATYVEYDNCDDNWQEVESSFNSRADGYYDGRHSAIFDTVVVDTTMHSGSFRVRFNFSSDAGWSNQDGDYLNDGGVILDSLTVRDATGLLSFEDFESANVGDPGAGDWNSCNIPGYGDFAALYPGLQLLQEDPCQFENDCVWGFFEGSTYSYACGGHPAVTAVPFGNARDQFIQNHIVSPEISWVGTGTKAEMSWLTYRDLPLDNLIFYEYRVRSVFDGCPSGWKTRWDVWYGGNKDWFNSIFELASMVEPGATGIQISIGVRDMCGAWCGVYSGSCHSHAPLIDDVAVYRIASFGPQWNVNDFDIFQDNFSTDGTTTGTVRADMTKDLLLDDNPAIVIGDSAVVTVNDPQNGIAVDPYTSYGAAVYGFVRVDPPQPAKSGASLTDDPFRWPVVDSTISTSGDKWYIIRFDSSYTDNVPPGPITDEFCLDLNDNLFTPGDTIWFFFGAKSDDVAGSWSYYFHALHATDNIGTTAPLVTGDIEVAMNNAEEMTCLPAAGLLPGNDILYVDDFSGRGGQPLFDTAFQQLGILDRVDRFDCRRPDSNVGSGLGSRVVNVYQQLIPVYRKIIWNSGNLRAGLVADGGDEDHGKSDDFGALFTFIDQSNRDPGLWINGDNNAAEWFDIVTASAVQLRTVYMNFGLVTGDHKIVGLPVSPLVIGVPGGAFNSASGPDTLVGYGGCNLINDFDVLDPQGAAVVEANYGGNPAYPAILSQQTPNSQGSTASVVLSGFSYHYVRDDRAAGIPDRVTHLKHVLEFLGNVTQDPTGVDPTSYKYSLSQNERVTADLQRGRSVGPDSGGRRESPGGSTHRELGWPK
jgi:hypothetical protein